MCVFVCVCWCWCEQSVFRIQISSLFVCLNFKFKNKKKVNRGLRNVFTKLENKMNKRIKLRVLFLANKN